MAAVSAPQDLGRARDVALFVASQVPYLDFDVGEDPWAAHEVCFKQGPDPLHDQMKQGLLLEVLNDTYVPQSICTRCGKWKIFDASRGSFEKIFQVVQQALNLKKIESISNKEVSLWAVQSWNGEPVEEPILADREAGEYLSPEIAERAYKDLLSLDDKLFEEDFEINRELDSSLAFEMELALQEDLLSLEIEEDLYQELQKSFLDKT